MATAIPLTKVRLRVDMRNLSLIGGGNLKEAIVEKEATLTSTWRNFLSNEVGLNLRGVGGDQVLVCSHTFVRKPHKNAAPKRTYGQPGWSANLDDKIEEFVARYKRTLPMFSIRLLPGVGGDTPSIPIALVPPQRPRNVRAGMTYRVPPPPTPPPPPPAHIRARQVRRRESSASARGGPYQRGGQCQAFGGGRGDIPPVLARKKTPSSVRGGGPSAGGGGNPQMESFLQGLFPPGAIRGRGPFGGDQQQQPRNLEVDHDESSDEDDDGEGGGIDYDNMSDGTAPADEEMELRNEGIPMDFIKAEAVQRLSRMDNSILLKARKEVDTLRQDHRWSKNVKRSPFCCFVIEDLLRPPQRN